MTEEFFLFLLVFIVGFGFYYVCEKLNTLVRLLDLLRTEMRQCLIPEVELPHDQKPSFMSYPRKVADSVSALVKVTPHAEEALKQIILAATQARSEEWKEWKEANEEKDK